jgi:Uma2 family endonuclease
MRAVMLRAPEELLSERRRRGTDRWDEVWEGVLHMVPPPSFSHQQFGSELLAVLRPLARRLGLDLTYETGIFKPGQGEGDYRVPDLVCSKPAQRSARGIEGRAELVVEILSPDDESRDKLAFYASLGVPEVWLVDPDTRVLELHVLHGGTFQVAPPDEHGAVRSAVLELTLGRMAGPRLLVTWSDGQAEL